MENPIRKLLANGETIETLVQKTGLSDQTIRQLKRMHREDFAHIRLSTIAIIYTNLGISLVDYYLSKD